MATLLQELIEITSAFEINGIEYAICGGLSMAIHGFADIERLQNDETG